MARTKPKIVAAAPAVIPPVPEVVYDHWETEDIHITDNGTVINGHVRWRRCRYTTAQVNGDTIEIREFAPDTVPDAVVLLELNNLDGLIEADPDFGIGRDTFMAAAVRRAKKLGILK